MMGNVAEHYGGKGRLAEVIAGHLAGSGRTLASLTTADLAGIDEFHIRGREATLELAARMRLEQDVRVLDLGSGLGGPARTVAEAYRCRVTGIDLTPALCDAAAALSGWVARRPGGVPSRRCDGPAARRRSLRRRDDDPCADEHRGEGPDVCRGAPGFEDGRRVRRIRRPSGRGRRRPVRGPLGARSGDQSPRNAGRDDGAPDGGRLRDSRGLGLDGRKPALVRAKAVEIATHGASATTAQAFLGDDFPQMARNQVRNLTERRIRTVSYVCEA